MIRIYILAAAMFASAFCGWYVEHLLFIDFQTKVQSLGKQQEIKNQQILTQQAAITQDITNEYKAKLSAVKRSYANSLLNPSSNEMPVISCTSTGTNEGTSNEVSAAQVSQLPEQCAETTLQLLELQQWILKQEKTMP